MTPSTNTPLLSFQEIADKNVLSSLSTISQWVTAMGKYLKENQIQLPDVFDIDGSVDVKSLPPVFISNFSELTSSFKNLERQLVALQTTLGSVNTSKQVDPQENQQLIRTLSKSFERLEKSVASLGKTIGEDRIITVDSSGLPKDFAESMRNVEDWIHKLYEFESNKVTFVPPPVTHVSVNANNGVIKTTNATVGNIRVGLPIYGVLANRRAVVIYNNSTTVTIFYGGSEVTASTGMPVPPSSYSPILDIGVNVVPYAVTSSGSADVRVMELSDTSVGR